MNKFDLESWILDTASEDGYSFKEIFDQITRNVTPEEFISSMISLFEEGMIDVYLCATGKEDTISLDKFNSRKSLENYRYVIDIESIIGVRHFIRLTIEGQQKLKLIISKYN